MPTSAPSKSRYAPLLAHNLTTPPLSPTTVQVPSKSFFMVAADDAERNEWVAAIGRATTENRRVRSYSEEVEYQEQQARQAAASASGGGGANSAPARSGVRLV